MRREFEFVEPSLEGAWEFRSLSNGPIRAKLSRGGEEILCYCDRDGHWESRGIGWLVSVLLNPNAENVGITVKTASGEHSFSLNYLGGAWPQNSMAKRPSGAGHEYVFINTKVVFRPAWKDRDLARGIESFAIPTGNERDWTPAYLALATILEASSLPYSLTQSG